MSTETETPATDPADTALGADLQMAARMVQMRLDGAAATETFTDLVREQGAGRVRAETELQLLRVAEESGLPVAVRRAVRLVKSPVSVKRSDPFERAVADAQADAAETWLRTWAGRVPAQLLQDAWLRS
jgi:hypothetical protein